MAGKLAIIFGLFITVVPGAYAVTPKRFRYLVLLLASIVSYAVYSGVMSVFLLFTIITVYFAGIGIDKVNKRCVLQCEGKEKPERKLLKKKAKSRGGLIMTAAIIINLGFLAVLKYFNFFAEAGTGILNLFGLNLTSPAIHVILPLGISYYTLQALSYIIDVRGGKYAAEKNIFKLALFISFFPQLNEGPFGRYDKLAPGLFGGEKLKADNYYRGFLVILTGLFKILVVSDRLSLPVTEIFKNYSNYGGWVVALGALLFTVQLYAEFSGYIDIAAGIGKLYGIELAENFNLPFIAQDVSDFWRRWHISLGAWFRDYVFYPLSMNKTSMKIREKIGGKKAEFIILAFTLLIVWSLTGLWHGANLKYLVYGLYYFALMILHETLKPVFSGLYRLLKLNESGRLIKTLRIAKTLILVLIGMLLFRADNLTVFGKMFASMFSPVNNSFNALNFIELKDFILALIGAAVLIVFGIIKANGFSAYRFVCGRGFLVKYAVCFVFVLIVVIFGAYGSGYSAPDPIYGGF